MVITPQPRIAFAFVVLAAVVIASCGQSEVPRAPVTDAPETVTTPAAEAVTAAPPEPVPTEAIPTYRTITGEAFYRERIRLPSDAVLTVTLLRRGDSGDTVIARSTVKPRLQIPIPFELEYPTTDISDGASYGLDVEITRRGEVIFALPAPAPVITNRAPETGLRLLLRRGI